MREARIILPVHRAPEKIPGLFTALVFLHDSLYKLAGGFTQLNGIGGWKGKEEPIVIYDVAVDETDPEIEMKLAAIAQEMGQLAGETCVYLRMPDGQVRFVEIQKDEDEKIDYSDIPEASEGWFSRARLVRPEDHQHEGGPVLGD